MDMEYRQCSRCVMDNASDNTIVFNQEGYCNYCTEAIETLQERYFPNEAGAKKLDELLTILKKEGENREYDCIMGISGGLDSAYLAYLGYQHGLRILAIHVDDGLNVPVASENIKKIIKKCGIDMIYKRPDMEQYYGVTKAFFKAGLPNLAIPQDNLIYAYMYVYAKKHRIRYYLSGGNFSTESILQRGNTHNVLDKKHIFAINKRFGTTALNKLQITSSFERRIKNQLLLRIKEVRPLDYIDYNKENAIKELADFCGFNYYGGKHYESYLTIFMQKYYLPLKFGVDKRRSHFSSLIVSGQMTREEALEELKRPFYEPGELNVCMDKMLEVFAMDQEEFENIMRQSPKQHEEFVTSSWKYVNKNVKIVRGY